jgi:competence protein ComEA
MFKKLLLAFAALYAVAAFAAVDVNKATAAELDGIKGIGPGISTKILDERKKGAFKDWDDLVTRVKGVGDGNAAKFSAEGMTVNGASYKGAAPKADAKPAAKKEDKPTAAKEEKAAAKKEDKPAAAAAPAAPAAKKEEKPAAAPAAKKDEKPAAAPAAPAAKKDDKPAAKAEEKKPAAKAEEKKPEAKKDAASGAKK